MHIQFISTQTNNS